MSSLSVKKGLLVSEIELPSSKSYGNRALILASVKKQPFTINRLPSSDDVTYLIDALKKIGLEIDQNEHSLTISNSFPECEGRGEVLEVGEGGTTARFLAFMLLLGKSPYTLILGERLKDRPWSEFIRLAQKLGVHAELIGNRLHLQGPVSLATVLEVDCSETTQFASGLQLSLAFTSSKINPLHLESSQSYWRMTEWVINECSLKDHFDVPLDWSSASYPLAFGALSHQINFPGLVYDPYQADAKLLHLLKNFGAIKENENEIIVSPINKSFSVKMDVSDCLDLVPALSFFLSHIEGIHELSGVENLVHKESNRLEGLIELVETFGRKAHGADGLLTINGNSSRISTQEHLKLANDHRMVMTGTLFLLLHSGGKIEPIESVNKSYPSFFGIIA